MKISYKNEKIKERLTTTGSLAQKYNKEVEAEFNEFLDEVASSDNLYNLQIMMRGRWIKKYKNVKNVWTARLTKKYRVHFSVESKTLVLKDIDHISITEVNKH